MANETGKMENLVTFDQLRSVFNGKRVFITGHTGFKGAWLTATLHLLGASLKGYALPPEYENGLYSYLKPSEIIESIYADIREKERLQAELLSFSPDFIFHLAAQPLVRASYNLPAETFDVNVVGTANLLEVLTKLHQPCSTVVITTDKVYENRESHIFYKETDLLGGYDPYSASKACTEIVASSFRNSFFHPDRIEQHRKAMTTARAGNVIGGGDWSRDRIVPDIVRALQKEKRIEVRNPSAIRPWQHVLEPILGYLMLAARLAEEPLRFSSPFNFGPLPEDHLTVKDLVETAITSWGSGAWLDASDPDSPHEAALLQLDINKARTELGWQPRIDARRAIEWTIKWYKQKEEDVVPYTFSQIRNFFAL
jgi:CDP-glucose 4,6-dehydratase